MESMAKEKSVFQKEVKDKAYERASGYFTKNEEVESRCYYSGYCDGAEWQRNRVWHTLEDKADLSKSIVMYDPDGNYMSPPVHCPFMFDDFFVKTMNKKYGANYTMWAYMEDIVPINLEE